jgi:hypothetical protein
MAMKRILLHIRKIEEGKKFYCPKCKHKGNIAKVWWHSPSQSYELTCVCGKKTLCTSSGSYYDKRTP